MSFPKALVFDLDGTLTVSKAPLAPETAELLSLLLKQVPVAITSGASQAQLMTQCVARLSLGTRLENLYLLPTSGAALYRYSGDAWERIYEVALTEKEMHEAEMAIEDAVAKTGVAMPPEIFGPQIERRENVQVSFSAAGQQASVAHKEGWDPDRAKRRLLASHILRLLPWAAVRIGGMTTIDITKKGVNKRYGIEQFSLHLGIPLAKMLYVGDALYPGGNDEVVIASGIETHQVTNPAEGAGFIRTLLGS